MKAFLRFVSHLLGCVLFTKEEGAENKDVLAVSSSSGEETFVHAQSKIREWKNMWKDI